jgi:hypothetical protein
MTYITIKHLSLKSCRKYKSDNGADTDLWIYQRWNQAPRRNKYPYKHTPWIYQRWDQAPRRNKYPYKHTPLDIPEVESGAKEE